MRANNTNEAVQMLELLLEFFDDGARWTRGRYHDGHGRRCLVAALQYLRGEHGIPSRAAARFLEEAAPGQFGLVYLNNSYCQTFGELRSVIVMARAIALGQTERNRAAAAVERWLLAEVEKERAARAAADGAAMGTPPGPLAQRRQCEVGAEEHPGQVEGAEPLPFIEARLLDALAEKKAGVVDQDVEPAETGDGRADRHLGAGFDHQPRGRRTDAARRTGDQSDLAIETVHPMLPFAAGPREGVDPSKSNASIISC